jgi:hypothetical protein
MGIGAAVVASVSVVAFKDYEFRNEHGYGLTASVAEANAVEAQRARAEGLEREGMSISRATDAETPPEVLIKSSQAER